jgi:hypothetical protein
MHAGCVLEDYGRWLERQGLAPRTRANYREAVTRALYWVVAILVSCGWSRSEP